MLALDLVGPQLDAWLARLVDASAIPAPGRASRCRLIDVPVLMWRIDAAHVRLQADRALSPYLAQWLTHAHEGAFGSD